MLSQNDELPKRSLLFVIFGGTGDLTHRKLLPALYNLTVEARLPAEFTVIAVGRREKTSQGYREEAKQSIASFSRSNVDESHLAAFLQRVHYQRVEFEADLDGYTRLAELLTGIPMVLRTNLFPGSCPRIFRNYH
jgi:glucose-6-phosphate 1-dehydrogenase